MKRFLFFLIFLFAALAILLLVFKTPDTDATLMKKKYGGPDSRYFVSPDGLSIHYRDQGCRDCPALVLLHGANSSLHTFEPIIPLLADDYRIISYDQPGFGLTGPHPDDDYSAVSMMRALDAVVDELGVESFALGGNSMGGWLSWRYVLENPEKLSALILMNASGAPKSADAPERKIYLGGRLIRTAFGRKLAEIIVPRSIIKSSLNGTITDKSLITDEMIDRYWELLRYPGNRRAAGLHGQVDRQVEYGQRLNEIKVPTLILWGADDMVTPAAYARVFDKEIENSQMVIFEGVAHVPMEEASVQTAREIRQFLSK